MKLQFTARAMRDLVRLRKFIAEKNPQAAQRMSQQLRKRILPLLEQPHLGVQLEHIGQCKGIGGG